MSKAKRKTAADHVAAGRGFFRWHDSGDLQSLAHFRRICEVARRSPSVRHWLPTREVGILARYDRRVSAGLDLPVPVNLIVRVSAFMVGMRPPKAMSAAARAGRPVGRPLWSLTSTVDWDGSSFRCPAYTQGGECRECRACWDPNVSNVDYLKH